MAVSVTFFLRELVTAPFRWSSLVMALPFAPFAGHGPLSLVIALSFHWSWPRFAGHNPLSVVTATFCWSGPLSSGAFLGGILNLSCDF